MVESKGLILTKAEKEILHLLTDEFLTIKQIQKQRKCSLQAVYKIIKKLKEKGAYDVGLNKVEKVQSTFNQADLRLHGQEFNIRILLQNNKYQKQLSKSNILFLDGNTIRLYKNSIEIYSGQSFYGKTINEAENKSIDYWKRFIIRLEHDLSLILIKNRARNIKIVNQHWARGDSEICDNSREYRERVWIYAEEDGKLAFITDDSFGFREDETLHPITAKHDRKAIDKQINDWRLNNPPTSSELSYFIGKITENQSIFDKNMSSHINAIQELGKGVKKLTKVMKGILKENQSLKLSAKNQKTLDNFIT